MQSRTSIILTICTTFLLKISSASEPTNSSLCTDDKITDINNLGFTLLNSIIIRQGNVLISPVGIAFNLGILYSAASNETAKEIERVLLKNETQATVEEVSILFTSIRKNFYDMLLFPNPCVTTHKCVVTVLQILCRFNTLCMQLTQSVIQSVNATLVKMTNISNVSGF